MSRTNSACGRVGKTVRGLLSIPKLPKTMLLYQEVDCKVTGAFEKSFFNFFFLYEIILLNCFYLKCYTLVCS